MATLASQFKKAQHNIEPTADAANAAVAHRLVSAALQADPRLSRLGIDPVLIGSYGRQVSIRRVKDVDVFARLTNADATLRPGEILDHVTAVLQATFDGVERQRRSVKVDFPSFDLSVDVVTARPWVLHPGQHWQIPERIDSDGSATWIETNPTEMGRLTTLANKRFLLSADDPDSGIYVPIVKLIRQIRRTWVDDQPGGYYFEVLTYHGFQDLQPTFGTVADYLTPVLQDIARRLPNHLHSGPVDPTMQGKTISTKATPDQVSRAAGQIQSAAAFATKALHENDPCRSAVLWQKLFGVTQGTVTPEDVFPLPSYCNSDGSTRAGSTTTVRGAATVPAGNDRYA